MCICMCVLVGVYVHHMPVAAHGSQRTQDPAIGAPDGWELPDVGA